MQAAKVGKPGIVDENAEQYRQHGWRRSQHLAATGD